MILHSFSFFDTKTGMYSSPFFCAHPGQAIRMAIDLGSDTNTLLGRHPADYVLYQIATWDDQNGMYEQTNHQSLGPVSGFLVNGKGN